MITFERVVGKCRPTFGVLFVVFLLAITTTSACENYTYIFVEKTAKAMTFPDSDPEVTETARFRELVSVNQLIAYRPPDFCLDQTATQAAGNMGSNREFLKTICGAWLAELERGFAAGGFQVVSWQTLVSNMNDRVRGDAVVETAKNRGVDILLLINSLESGHTNPRKEMKAELSFFEYDWDESKKGSPLAVNQDVQKSLIQEMRATDLSIPAMYVSAALDVTAIDLKTNQSIWFFKQTLSKQIEEQASWSGLFGCYDYGDCSSYYEPDSGDDESEMDHATSAKIVLEGEDPGRSANPHQKEEYELIREVVTNLVKEFSRGTQ